MTGLRVKELRKIYRSGAGITSVSFEARPGGMHALLGKNGAGKSTTILCIMGILTPDSGTVEVSGKVVGKDEHIIRRSLGFSPELPSLPEYLTAKECLISYGLIRGMDRSQLRKDVPDLLGEVELSEKSETRVSELSRGMLAKLGSAIALLGEPEVLILDEPTAGLDPVSKRAFMSDLNRLTGSNRTVIISSHQLSDVQKYCRNATIMHNGRTVMESGIDGILKVATTRKQVTIEFKGLDQDLIAEVKKIDGVIAATLTGEGKLLVSLEDNAQLLDALSRIASEAGKPMISFSPVEPDLEDAFLKIIGERD